MKLAYKVMHMQLYPVDPWWRSCRLLSPALIPTHYVKGQKVAFKPAGVSIRTRRMSGRGKIPLILSTSFTLTSQWTYKWKSRPHVKVQTV